MEIEELKALYQDDALPKETWDGRLTYSEASGRSYKEAWTKSLSNIDISLRLMVMMMDNQRELNDVKSMLKKSEGEIKRLSVNNDMLKDNLEHEQGKSAHFESEYNKLREKLLKIEGTVRQ